MNLPWKIDRQTYYSILVALTLVVYAWIGFQGGIDRAGFPSLVAFGVLSGVWVIAIIVDTVYHAWKGKGQACIHCGHVRKLASFRIYSQCPKCSK